MLRFGPSGNSEEFYKQGFKSSIDMPTWLKNMGLNAYEYQCGNGIRVQESTAVKIGENAKENDIFLSIHAPYYINLASLEDNKRKNSKNYIIETLSLARLMQAKRIVLHMGSCRGIDRKIALNRTIEAFKEVIKETDELGYSDITMCPEVLGKINQIGSLDEIIEICKVDDGIIPTIDFGHIHAREMGSLNNISDFENILTKLINELGFERVKHFHCHFSRIEFTKGGEKKHWTQSDTQFGPDFIHLAHALFNKKLEPVIIAESRGEMAKDALILKNIYTEVTIGGI